MDDSAIITTVTASMTLQDCIPLLGRVPARERAQMLPRFVEAGLLPPVPLREELLALWESDPEPMTLLPRETWRTLLDRSGFERPTSPVRVFRAWDSATEQGVGPWYADPLDVEDVSDTPTDDGVPAIWGVVPPEYVLADFGKFLALDPDWQDYHAATIRPAGVYPGH